MLFKRNIFDYTYRDGDMGYFRLSYKGPKGANGSNEPILPIPVKYLWNPTGAHPSTLFTHAASPPKADVLNTLSSILR